MIKLFGIVIAMLVIVGRKYIYAADMTIICNPGENSTPTNCDVTPSKTAAIFDESEYPLFDLKPGDFVERQITVTNNRDEECYFMLDNVVVEIDTVASTGEKFSEELLTELSDTSASTGQISFDDLFSLVPLYITTLDPYETEVLDWTVTFDPQAGNEFQNARLEFDFDWNFSCGEPPFTEFFLEKDNDSMGIVQEPGDDVVYTLTVTAPDFPVFNAYVVDLPPGGFGYVGGSWTAYSSVRGDIKNSPTAEPTYASPGTWFIGDLVPGEVVTLTYVTDIDNNQESGLYRDLAWAWGTITSDSSSTVVYANEATGYFVGTYAEVDIDDTPEVEVEIKTEEIEEEEGEVLGETTYLPATGAENIWLYLVLGLGVLGVTMIFLSRKLRRSISVVNRKAVNTTAFLAAFLFSIFALRALAASPLSIRVEDPESPNHYDEFYINFVVLDILDRPSVAKCYKRAPGEISYSQFGPVLNIANGGDDGYCQVTASMLPDDGTYKFYVEATAGGDVETSSIVTVDYDSGKPGEPKYIEKEKDGSCKYKVEFKTADDGGDTTSARVYRSDKKEFEANSSTQIKDFSIGSNQTKTFTDDKPDCGKTYYYAVRAFDSAGNGSDVRVEEVEKTVTVTKTTKETKVESVFGGILEAVTSGSEGIAPETAVEEAEVSLEGEEVPAAEEELLEEEEVAGEEAEEGEVLGTHTFRDFISKVLEYWPLLLILLVVVYLYVKSQKEAQNKTRNKS